MYIYTYIYIVTWNKLYYHFADNHNQPSDGKLVAVPSDK